MESWKWACFCYWWKCWWIFRMEISNTELLNPATYSRIRHSGGKDAASSNGRFSLCTQMFPLWAHDVTVSLDMQIVHGSNTRQSASRHKSKRSKPQCSCKILTAAWIAARNGDISENECSVQRSAASSARRLTANRSCGPLRGDILRPALSATPNRHRGLWLLRERYIAQGVTGGECKTQCESRRPSQRSEKD